MPPLLRATPARAAVASLALASALPLAACGSGDDARAAPSGDTAPGDFPVTVDNCGFEVTIDSAPERIVTVKSSTTEMVLALGLQDRLVGAAFLDAPVPAEYGAEDLPVLSDKVPGREAVLGTGADLVYAGWESNFPPTAPASGTRSTPSASPPTCRPRPARSRATSPTR
jgi:iron complex transport system substrate-binding protein